MFLTVVVHKWIPCVWDNLPSMNVVSGHAQYIVSSTTVGLLILRCNLSSEAHHQQNQMTIMFCIFFERWAPHLRRVKGTTRYRTDHFPIYLKPVTSKKRNSIPAINHLAPLGQSNHGAQQVNFAVSKLPPGNLSITKWHYNKANMQGHLVAASHRRERIMASH